MNQKGNRMLAVALILSILVGCTPPAFLPAQQNRASSATSAASDMLVASDVESSKAKSSSDKLLDAPGQVTIYRKVGDNPATHVTTIECDRSVYQPETDTAELLRQWGLSKSAYVFIGWFYMDENNVPTEWTGDKDIKVRAEKETSIVAVFNTYYRTSDAPRGGTIQLYCSIDGAASILSNTIMGVSDYPLPTPPDAILKEQLPKKQDALHFQGWYTADSTGQPISKLEDTHVLLNKGEIRQITAVYSKTD